MKTVLFITAHDYRTPRKASLHFIADELIKRGYNVNFFSMRYSFLSKKRPDSRHVIAEKSNKLEVFNKVNCFLWKSLIHPVNTNKRYLQSIEKKAFQIYVWLTPRLVKKWIQNADIIFFESGAPSIYLPLAKKINPNATIIYIGSDELDAINVAQYVKDIVKNHSQEFNYIIINSPQMGKDFSNKAKLFYVPHGIDKNVTLYGDPNPYKENQINGVCVGSMLFDLPTVVKAAQLFPNILFHIIGSGQDINAFSGLKNIIFYDEMFYEETIRYIKHADFGLAPYRYNEVPPSLSDTSMKLQQYAYFGIPAVCPSPAVGRKSHRFGYKPDDVQSIKNAINFALDAGNKDDLNVIDWSEVTERILSPTDFNDTDINIHR